MICMENYSAFQVLKTGLFLSTPLPISQNPGFHDLQVPKGLARKQNPNF